MENKPIKAPASDDIHAQAVRRDEQSRLAEAVKELSTRLEKEVVARKKAEEELHKSKRMFELIFNNGNDGITVHGIINGEPGTFTEVNDVVCEQLGYSREELLRMSPVNITPDESSEDRRRAIRLMETNGRAVFEMWHVCKSGVRMPVEISSKYFHYNGNPCILSILRDITGRKKNEEIMRTMDARLRQSEKMESIGTLAGGIAHDFNNILGGIIGYTDMSLDLAEHGSVLEKNLRMVIKASGRAQQLVNQILAFSRQGEDQQKSLIAIRPIIKEVLDQLHGCAPSSVIIKSALHTEMKPVLGNPGKIREILLNLATNAVYAMEGKGTFTVRLYAESFEKEIAGRIGTIAPGEYVVIEVADTGAGMDALTLKRAFDPFFTTKPVGQGTGMGLSVVLGVVQSHGGNVQVESEPGKGSTFRIFLPVIKDLEPDGAGTDT